MKTRGLLLLAMICTLSAQARRTEAAHPPPPWVTLPFWAGMYQARGGPRESLQFEFDSPSHGSIVSGWVFAGVPGSLSAEAYRFSGTGRGNHVAFSADETGGGDHLTVSATISHGNQMNGRLSGQINGAAVRATFSLSGAP